MSETIGRMSAADVASKFESLGGGSLNANGWAFGCEFGFFQRHVGIEPMGLLRWASIAPADLQRALERNFVGVDDPAAIEAREHTDWDWGYIQTTYGLNVDHTNIRRTDVSSEDAAAKIAAHLGYLRRKLVDDMAAREKLFVYRTYDHTMSDAAVSALADALGGATLCYVRVARDGETPFMAERTGANLIVGTIDRFAPRDGLLEYNPDGWEAVCRSVLRLLEQEKMMNVTECNGSAAAVEYWKDKWERSDAMLRATAETKASASTAPHTDPEVIDLAMRVERALAWLIAR